MDAKPELLKALADALNAYDQAVRDLIRDELNATIRPGLEDARDKAAARLQEAFAAIEPARQQVTETDEAIGYAETELATYRKDLESGSVSIRANARPHVNEWQAELESLRRRKAEQQEGLNSVTADHRSARDALAAAEMALAGFEMNLENGSYSGDTGPAQRRTEPFASALSPCRLPCWATTAIIPNLISSMTRLTPSLPRRATEPMTFPHGSSSRPARRQRKHSPGNLIPFPAAGKSLTPS